MPPKKIVKTEEELKQEAINKDKEEKDRSALLDSDE